MLLIVAPDVCVFFLCLVFVFVMFFNHLAEEERAGSYVQIRKFY